LPAKPGSRYEVKEAMRLRAPANQGNQMTPAPPPGEPGPATT
jgi:hypothetical protein